MGVRSRLSSGLARASRALAPGDVAKGFGTSVPPAIEAAEAASQMTPASPFSPGEPIGPYDGFSRTPRARDYVTGYNIATRPRSHERVAFETLKSLIDSYDVAQIVIRHRIASLRSMGWKLTAADGHEGDVSADIAEGTRVLRRPDGTTLFKSWLAKYLRDVLAYDAGALYRMRNRAGRPVGLSVVSGPSIAPLLDYWGGTPAAPAPAYVQYANGLPWNWLSTDDLIYEPYDPQPDSIYGRAPLEDVLLTANTDIRFQLYFLERFTAGNIPAGFASSPENWSPDQIEQFQEYWDGFMLGDQSMKHQIRWIPSGSKLAWSNEKNFDDKFSEFLMRKVCAAFAVVPADLGFTDTVNKSSGESQADVQHRVGDLPLALHVQDILTAFLQDDLQLPVQFRWDLGEEQDDRVNLAQVDDIYMKQGVIGPSEIREMRYGLSDPVPIPRTIFTERAGPIPIASLFAVAGQIDPSTGLPEQGAPLPHKVFGGTEGVLPNPPIKVMSLAEQEYGPGAMPPAPPPQPVMTPADETPALPPAPVAKDGEGAGITSATGITGYDLIGREDEDEDEDEPEAAVAKELAAFRRFAKARRKAGEWRDFEFAAVTSGEARRLNAEGRELVLKAGGAAPKRPGPSPDGQPAWHGWTLDLQAADHWAPKVTAAVKRAIPKAKARRMGADYLAAHPNQDGSAPDKRNRNKAAVAWLLAWLAAQGITLVPASLALGIVTDGYAIGAISAASQVTGQSPASPAPGDEDSARRHIAEAGLAAALALLLSGGNGTGPAAETAAERIAAGYLGSLAVILAGTDADWADSQATLGELGGMLSDALASDDLAVSLVGTQISVYSGHAAHDYYLQNAVKWKTWVTAEDDHVCRACLENEAEGPVPVGTPFSDGHYRPPGHDRCRCAIMPSGPPGA